MMRQPASGIEMPESAAISGRRLETTKPSVDIVNDPAAKKEGVRRVYRRRELFKTWQERGEGIAYLIHPA